MPLNKLPPNTDLYAVAAIICPKLGDNEQCCGKYTIGATYGAMSPSGVSRRLAFPVDNLTCMCMAPVSRLELQSNCAACKAVLGLCRLHTLRNASIYSKALEVKA